MKAIAIQPPFASFIAMGIIDVWNMPFMTDYRGRILIVADKKRMTPEEENAIPKLWHHIFFNNDMMYNIGDIFYMTFFSFAAYPVGEIVGYADIVDCSDNPKEFEGNPWYQGGIGWRFANAHFCEPNYDEKPAIKIPDTCTIYDIAGVDGRTTRFYEEGKRNYPYSKGDELYLRQSYDAYYKENEDDYETGTSTLWFYADDPYMQLALTGKIGGTEVLPFKILNHQLEGHDDYSRHRITNISLERDCNGDMCFLIRFKNERHYEMVEPEVEKEAEQKQAHQVFDSFNILTDGSFKAWLKQHQNVSGIAIEGELDVMKADEYNVLSKQTEKYIDISKLKLTSDIYNGRNEYELIKEYFSFQCKDRETRMPIILVLCANRHFSNLFKVHKHAINTADNKVCAYVFSLKKEYQGIALSKEIEHVGNYACQSVLWLREVNLPYRLKTIGDYAFSECDHLCTVLFPQHLEKIGEGAFAYTEIEDLEIPEGITEIPEECFYFVHLLSLKLPSTLKKIGYMAFTLFDLQETLKVPEGVVEIGRQALEGIENVEFPSTLQKLDDAFYYECNCMSDPAPDEKPYITVHPDNPYFYSKNGKIYEHGHIIQYIPFREDKYKGENNHQK